MDCLWRLAQCLYLGTVRRALPRGGALPNQSSIHGTFERVLRAAERRKNDGKTTVALRGWPLNAIHAIQWQPAANQTQPTRPRTA